MSITTFNRRWATVLLEALTRHGVRHICIAPGSRSTPLTLAAAAHPALCQHTHFDERGLGHLALGLAKASAQPVAVIVTSGTALAGLYPAVIEAYLTGERLVLLTADRPPELIDCGANQAISQTGIYASHVTGVLNLPRPTPEIPACWLLSALDSLLCQQRAGAVHINCPFAEPLYGEIDNSYLDWQQAPGDWWHSDQPWLREQVIVQTVQQPDWWHWRQQNGVIIAGRLSVSQGYALAGWAAQLGWPLIGDILSQTGQPLPCADLWLARDDARAVLAQSHIVLQFGGNLTSKRLLQWQSSCKPEEYWLIDPLPGRRDPAQHRGRRLVADIEHWLTLHPPATQTLPVAQPLPAMQQPASLSAPATARPCAGWAMQLASISARVYQHVVTHTSQFGETQLAHRLPQLLPSGGQLFIGNSLVIRFSDALAQLPKGYPVYANRGASGIDGLIATSAGVQRATGRPTLVLIGDLSTLYDLNSLALLRQLSAPCVLIVVNNNGGQIFSLLDTQPAVRQQFYCMPHHLGFQHAAALFDLAYQRPANWSQLQQCVQDAFQHSSPQATLIEISVPPQQGVQHFRQLLAQVGEL